MEERERMLDTIMEMQEWNIKKDKQIETLEQENQALKDRWNKLTSWFVDTLNLLNSQIESGNATEYAKNNFEVLHSLYQYVQILERE